MKAVVGLGNPGKKYERTRHNIGRLAVRSFLERFLTSPPAPPRRGEGQASPAPSAVPPPAAPDSIWTVRLGQPRAGQDEGQAKLVQTKSGREWGQEMIRSTELNFSVVYRVGDLVFVVEPLVYMNVSGVAVREICEKYLVTPHECLIVYDDYAIPFGKLRARQRGGAGGHHGMESVIAELETDEIPRLRIGIGTEQSLADLTEYVLGEFTPEEQARLPEIFARAADAIECFIQKDIETVMNRFNALS